MFASFDPVGISGSCWRKKQIVLDMYINHKQETIVDSLFTFVGWVLKTNLLSGSIRGVAAIAERGALGSDCISCKQNHS